MSEIKVGDRVRVAIEGMDHGRVGRVVGLDAIGRHGDAADVLFDGQRESDSMYLWALEAIR